MSTPMTTSILRGCAAVGLAALLAGCATHVPGANEKAETPTQRFEAKVTPRPEEVRLAVHAQGISPRQADALTTLVANWRDDEGGLIGIQAPSQGVDSASAYRMSESARSFLISQGVPTEDIEVTSYTPGAQAEPALLVGYLRFEAEVPECGKTWTNISHSMKNDVQPNFGCAVTANMAAQMADPGDLLGPRRMTPQDAARRQDVLDKYRRGEITSSKTDSIANGKISDAVN
jgi:pilus assembly protein CpaD